MSKRSILLSVVLVLCAFPAMNDIWVSQAAGSGAQPNPPTLVLPANGATGVSTDPTLRVNVTDPESDAMNVTFYGRLLGDASQTDFSIVMLPDTQWYTTSGWFWTDNDATAIDYPRMTNDGPQTFNAQTQWIVNNRQALNIKYVAHVGDIVECESGDSGLSDPTELDEWDITVTAIGFLEDPITTGLTHGIPFGLAVGNHDDDPAGTATNYNIHFGYSHFAGRSYYGGHYGSDNDNHYGLFSAGGMDFIVIYLEHAVNSTQIQWAEQLLQQYDGSPSEYRRGIVVQHNPISAEGILTTVGNNIVNTLQNETNFFLLLGGHIEAESRLTTYRYGRNIYVMAADYAIHGDDFPTPPGWRTHDTGEGMAWQGGNGWLRILKFSPTMNEIQVQTYSPTMHNGGFTFSSPNGQFETDADSQFTLSYPMGGSPGSFSQIDTVTGVASGANASTTWSGRAGNKLYEWYTTASDGTSTSTSPYWTFSTSDGPVDTDGDGVLDTEDNCPGTLPGADVGSDGCADYQVDADGDGFCDPGAISGGYSSCVYGTSPCAGGSTTNCHDNCPTDSNTDQADPDSDAIGTVCDNCPEDNNATQTDGDGDAVGNACDLCPNTPGGVAIRVTGCPQAIPDFDADGDVDLEDYGRFQSCFSGSGTAQTDPNCMTACLDGDSDVDMSDFDIFLACLSGPNIAVTESCWQ